MRKPHVYTGMLLLQVCVEYSSNISGKGTRAWKQRNNYCPEPALQSASLPQAHFWNPLHSQQRSLGKPEARIWGKDRANGASLHFSLTLS